MRNTLWLVCIFALLALGCGVKGKPLPPEEPPVLGRGEPNFLKATEKIKLKPKPPVDDWDDEE